MANLMFRALIPRCDRHPAPLGARESRDGVKISLLLIILCFTITCRSEEFSLRKPGFDCEIGHYTTTRSGNVPFVTEAMYWPDFVKASKIGDEYGVKEMTNLGRLGNVSGQPLLLLLDLDLSAIDEAERYTKKLLAIRVNEWKDCKQRNIIRVERRLRLEDCGELRFDSEYGAAFHRLRPDTTVSQLWLEKVMAKVRMVEGSQAGLAGWLPLNSLRLPTISDKERASECLTNKENPCKWQDLPTL
jgi:hypothetical protein